MLQTPYEINNSRSRTIMAVEVSFEDTTMLDVSLNVEIDENNNYTAGTRIEPQKL